MHHRSVNFSPIWPFSLLKLGNAASAARRELKNEPYTTAKLQNFYRWAIAALMWTVMYCCGRMYRNPLLYSNRWTGEMRGKRKHRRLCHMKSRCKRIRKIKIKWQLNGFPFSVLYGKHCWTYGTIIKMKHLCTATTTFCDTSTIKIFIILWHFLDVIHTFNNSLISYSHV
jgi:hypothetical protein